MLLYVLDEIFYVYGQVKNSQRADDKLVLAYEILCISANCYTDQQNGVEKTGMPDALALLNVDDVHRLEHLTWAVYDGILLVGLWLNSQANTLGVQCWLGYISMSTGATMMQPIACHRC